MDRLDRANPNSAEWSLVVVSTIVVPVFFDRRQIPVYYRSSKKVSNTENGILQLNGISFGIFQLCYSTGIPTDAP